jgi:hypothetical protein
LNASTCSASVSASVPSMSNSNALPGPASIG